MKHKDTLFVTDNETYTTRADAIGAGAFVVDVYKIEDFAESPDDGPHSIVHVDCECPLCDGEGDIEYLVDSRWGEGIYTDIKTEVCERCLGEREVPATIYLCPGDARLEIARKRVAENQAAAMVRAASAAEKRAAV